MKVPQIVPRGMLRHRLISRALAAKKAGASSLVASIDEFLTISDMVPIDQFLNSLDGGPNAQFLGLRVDISSRHGGHPWLVPVRFIGLSTW